VSDQGKVLIIMLVIVGIAIWVAFEDDPRCWRWWRRRQTRRRAWRDLQAQRGPTSPQDERAKPVLP
jgi:uncharacterized iron-regulated membrane protein